MKTVEAAAEAVWIIEADHARASAHPSEIAHECVATEQVLAGMLGAVGC